MTGKNERELFQIFAFEFKKVPDKTLDKTRQKFGNSVVFVLFHQFFKFFL
jgi:hypothetical protein